MIINSFANLHILIHTMDTAITEASAVFALTSSSIVTDFVDFTSSNDLKITADILGLLFALIAAPTWNSCKPTVSYHALFAMLTLLRAQSNSPSFEKRQHARLRQRHHKLHGFKRHYFDQRYFIFVCIHIPNIFHANWIPQ